MRGERVIQNLTASIDFLTDLSKKTTLGGELVDLGARINAAKTHLDELDKAIKDRLKASYGTGLVRGNIHSANILKYNRETLDTKGLKEVVPSAVWEPFIRVSECVEVRYKV